MNTQATTNRTQPATKRTAEQARKEKLAALMVRGADAVLAYAIELQEEQNKKAELEWSGYKLVGVKGEPTNRVMNPEGNVYTRIVENGVVKFVGNPYQHHIDEINSYLATVGDKFRVVAKHEQVMWLLEWHQDSLNVWFTPAPVFAVARQPISAKETEALFN